MENEKPVTFGKVCKVAVHRWKLFLIVTAAVAVGGTLALKYGFNNMAGKYVANFTYNSADLKSGVYCDGSQFYYAKMVTKENLERVKNSSEDFASIDIDKMLENSGISVIETITQITSEKSAYSYTVSAKVSYFKNSTQAKAFIDGVVSYPLEIDKSVAVASSFDTNLDLYDTATSYESKLSYLEGQANALEGYYLTLKNDKETVIGSAAASLIESNTVQINNIVGAQKITYAEDGTAIGDGVRPNITSLKNLIHTYGFVMDYESSDFKTLNTKLEALQAESDALGATIAQIKADSPTSAELPGLIIEKANVDYEIGTVENKIKYEREAEREADFPHGKWGEAKEEFVNTLKSYRSGLASCVDSYIVFLNKMYIEGADVAYETTNVIGTKLVLSLPLCIVGGLVVGALAAGVTNLIIDRKKLHE